MPRTLCKNGDGQPAYRKGICRRCYQKTPDGRRWLLKHRIRKLYSMTLAEYDALVIKQNGGCAICGTKPDGSNQQRNRLDIDHNHETGKVRGLLCNNCNQALGRLNDDPNLLRLAAAYLERNS